MDNDRVISATRRWISSVVIRLNLCPFAQRVFDANRIRYVIADAADEASLLKVLGVELETLASSPISQVETTLLIHPHALGDFLDYNDFFDLAEALVEKLGLEGVIQLAGFHPSYRFADTADDAVENYTNRSPYPMLHLLREESISAVAQDEDVMLEISRRNIETLQSLGRAKMLAMLKAIEADQQNETESR